MSIETEDWHLSEEAEPTFQVELRSEGNRCWLILSGSLCCTSIAALEVQVDQLGCLPCDEVYIDLGGLRELDQVGAKVLIGLRHYVAGRGGQMRVIGAKGQVADILRASSREAESTSWRWPGSRATTAALPELRLAPYESTALWS